MEDIIDTKTKSSKSNMQSKMLTPSLVYSQFSDDSYTSEKKIKIAMTLI